MNDQLQRWKKWNWFQPRVLYHGGRGVRATKDHIDSTQRTSSGTVAPRERSTAAETRRGRPALLNSSSTATVAARLTPEIAPQAKRSQATAARSTPSQIQVVEAEPSRVAKRRRPAVHSPESAGPRIRQRTTVGTEPQASGIRFRRTRALAGLGIPSTERTENIQGTYENEAEDIDDSSDEDESTPDVRERALRSPQVKFPTEDEFRGGYIWRQDFYFEASIENIRSVQNADTNHHILSQRRVTEMYRQLAGHEASVVMPLTLQPIAYIVEDVGPDNERQRREVFFGASGGQKGFEAAYL